MIKQRLAKYIFVQSLTFGRIPLIFLFLIITMFVDTADRPGWFILAFAAMILSAATDLFDGYFARKFEMTTRLGGYADPLADKVFYLVTFPAMVFLAGPKGDAFHTGLLLALTIIFLLRDQWISFLRSIGSLHGVDAKANWSGKARTLISFPVICMIYYYLQAPKDGWIQIARWVVISLEFVALGLTLISMWVYTIYYWPWVKIEARIEPDEPDEDKKN